MKRIRITESQYQLLKEFQDELTYYKFYSGVVDFLNWLLQSPSDAQPNDILKSHGITRKLLIQGLVDRGILTRKNKVVEVPSEDGKMTSKMLAKYSVIRKNFEKKLHRLHIQLCECSKPNVTMLDEDGAASIGGMSCGFAMQGGGSNPSAGQYDAPVSGVQKRKFWFPDNEDKPKKSRSKTKQK